MTASNCLKAVARAVPTIATLGLLTSFAVGGAVVPLPNSASVALPRTGDDGLGRAVEADDPFGPREPVVEIGIDPNRFDEHEWRIGELFAESFGRGRLILEDGDVLRGRVVTEGFDIRPGATVYIEEGTTLIAMGDCWLNGPLVPYALEDEPREEVGDADAATGQSNAADAESDVFDPFDDLADTLDLSQLDDEELEEILSMAAAAPATCPTEVKQVGKGGRKPKEIKMFVNGTMNINAAIGGCAGPAGVQAPNPAAVNVAGARSARAIGGRGGDGVDVNIQALGNSTMNINATLCNGEGHKGADATATGAAGAPCDCGGDAYAEAGDGGDAGFLLVAAGTINWGLGGSVTVMNGGAGGVATATGGVGGDCDVCGGVGGRGGDATARAGRAGGDSRITVTARAAMNPGPAVALANNVFFAAPQDGGAATASAGKGGRGGDCLECGLKGGNGGPGGTSLAVGARGGHGLLLAASINGNIVGSKSSDGGDGGAATAVPGQGGNGGNGGTCPCTYPGGRPVAAGMVALRVTPRPSAETAAQPARARPPAFRRTLRPAATVATRWPTASSAAAARMAATASRAGPIPAWLEHSARAVPAARRPSAADAGEAPSTAPLRAHLARRRASKSRVASRGLTASRAPGTARLLLRRMMTAACPAPFPAATIRAAKTASVRLRRIAAT